LGWLNNLLNKIGGVAPTDWTLIDGIIDPGFGISGTPILPDQCYIEIYVEALRLEKARRFATTFHGVIYSFASLARFGSERVEVAAVSKPKNLATLDAGNLGRVITVSKRIMPPIPWRGSPLSLELGLFSVKTGNLLTPLVDYVAKVSEKAGLTVVSQLKQFAPLVTEGLDIIAGQTGDTAIELAIDTDLALEASKLYALVAVEKEKINANRITIDSADRKLLNDGKPLNAAYCVFSVRSTSKNAEWGSIASLQEAFADFVNAINTGRQKEAQEALAGFNRRVITCPDLISADKDELRRKAKRDLVEAFPGGGQSSDKTLIKQRFEKRRFSDLKLYG
jgi:hypothetical protein